LVDSALGLAREFSAVQEISHSWDEVEALVRWDPEVFANALSRAANRKYLGGSSSRGALSLWIACNLVETMRLAPWCYFCSRQVTRDDFLNADAQVEHFEPRGSSGTHEPANVTLACASCNELKSDLTADDFRVILTDPDAFFAGQGRHRRKRRQLEEFAEIYLPRIAGPSGYVERHGIDSRDMRPHWEDLKEQYRRRWQTSD
jgi:hypothetical protein